MPSTLVHLALGALLAAALLGPVFGRRSLVVVLALVALPDLDTFAGLWLPGAHRALLHTLLLPAVLGVVLLIDARLGERSRIRERWGDIGVRTAWVGAGALAFAGIGPDLVTNGVNVLYPLHDQFYRFTGELLVSNQRGIVQTFVDLSPEAASGGESGRGSGGGGSAALGSTAEVHYSTGVDPAAGDEPSSVERVFLVVDSGLELLLVAVGAVVTGVRLRDERRRE